MIEIRLWPSIERSKKGDLGQVVVIQAGTKYQAPGAIRTKSSVMRPVAQAVRLS